MQDPTGIAHKLIADVAVFSAGKVALVRYGDAGKYDQQSGWFLPDDYLADFEHPDAAGRRIVAEQFGISDIPLHLNHIESFKGNDASWHLVFHYVATFDSIPATGAPPDQRSLLTWFPLAHLPERVEVAHHGWALDVIAAILSTRLEDVV